MLSWVVKVVPQLPEPPPKKVEDQKEVKPEAPPPAPPPVVEKKVKFQDECKPEAPKANNPKPEVQAVPGNGPVAGSQAGVLTWISSALPQPAPSPKLSRASSTTSEEAAPASKPEDEKGMIAWISQGLEKVVPQPDLKAKETPAAEQPADVQVSQKEAAPSAPSAPAAPAAPEPPVVVVEVESDREDSKPVQPSVMEWIKHGIEKVVPQPEIYVRSKSEGNQKTEAPAAAKVEAPAAPAASKPTEPEKSTKEAEQQPNMMGWIVSEIGRMLPQPVQKTETGSDDVQTRGKGGQSPLK